MDQSSSRAAGLSRPDRESEAEEGAAPATRVKSGPRLWELGDIERNLWRNKDTPFKKRQKNAVIPFRRPGSNFLSHGLEVETAMSCARCRESRARGPGRRVEGFVLAYVFCIAQSVSRSRSRYSVMHAASIGQAAKKSRLSNGARYCR